MSGIPLDRLLAEGPFGIGHISGVQTTAPQQLAQIVAAYGIELLTTARALCTTPSRVLAYNILVRNNFHNAELNGLIDRAFRFGWYQTIVKTAVAVDHPETIKRSCEYVLAVFTGEQIFNNLNLLGPSLTQTALQNARNLIASYNNEVASNLAKISFNELSIAPSGGVTSSYYAGTHNPPQVSIAGVSTVGAGLTQVATNSEWNQNSAPSNPSPVLNQATFVATSTSSLPAGEQVIDSTQPFNLSAIGGNSDLTSKPGEVTHAPVVVSYYEPLPASKTIYPKTITTHRGLHEMDAIRHSRPYFGQLSISAKGALLGLQGSVFEIQRASTTVVPPAERLTVETIAMLKDVNEIFDFARKEHRRLGHIKKTPQFVTRVMGVALNPVYTDRLFQELVPDLYKGDIRLIGERLSKIVDCKTPETPTPEQHQRLVTASYIDRTLGRSLNDFLARGLRIKAKTSEFADSIAPCTAHVTNTTRFAPAFGNLYHEFLNTLGENLKQYGTKEIIESCYQSMIEEDQMEDDGIAVLPIAHTVTYCHLTSKELDWTTLFNGTNIDGKVTPTLDQLCMTLHEDKRSYGFKSSYDWLLTGDGETYLVYENPESVGTFRLFPISGLNINRIDSMD